MNKLFHTVTSSNDDNPEAHRDKADKSVLLIRELELHIFIGVHPSEKAARQRVLVSVEVFLRDKPDISNDCIDTVLSYQEIIIGIEGIADQGHINLVETYAERIADYILEFPEAKSCTVRVEKPDIFANAASVGIEISRHSLTH